MPVAPRPDAKFAFGEFWPDLRDKPRAAVEFKNPELLVRRPNFSRPPIFYTALRGFSLASALPSLHPFPSRLLLTAQDRIESDGGACPPSSRRDFFRPNVIFRFAKNEPDLKDKPLFTFLWESSAAVFLSQKRDAFLIHSFPPWLCSPPSHECAKVRRLSGRLGKHASLPARREIPQSGISAGLEGTTGRQRRRAGTPTLFAIGSLPLLLRQCLSFKINRITFGGRIFPGLRFFMRLCAFFSLKNKCREPRLILILNLCGCTKRCRRHPSNWNGHIIFY